VGNRGSFCKFAWQLWKSVSTLAVMGDSTYGGVIRRHRKPVFERHRIRSKIGRWDIRWVSGRVKTWFLLYLAWRLWKSVLRLSAKENTISSEVVRRNWMPVFGKH
jgi:hypothetical protein